MRVCYSAFIHLWSYTRSATSGSNLYVIMFHIAILSILVLLFTWLRYVTNIELKTNELITVRLQPFCAELFIAVSVSNHLFFLSKITNSKMFVGLLPDWCTVQRPTQRLYSWSGGRDDIFITCLERRRTNTEPESTWNSLLNFPKGNQALPIYYADLNTFICCLEASQTRFAALCDTPNRTKWQLSGAHLTGWSKPVSINVLLLFLHSLIQYEELWHSLN